MQHQHHTRIFDTTLRDGEQTPGVHFSIDQKAAMARCIEAFGVDTIEAGFPASSPGDFQAVQAVSAAVTHCEVAALARCVPGDVQAAAEAVKDAAHPVIHVVMGTSDIHLAKKTGMSRVEAVRRIEEAVSQAARHVPEVEFSAEDATRSDPVFLRQCVYAAITHGATRVNIADTAGCATPTEFGRLIRDVVDFVEGRAVVSVHCHNDVGMATANTVAAVQAGAGQVKVTSNGIGERAGNAGLEEVVRALAAKGIARTNVDVSQAVPMSEFVAAVSGVPVQPNRAVDGANAFPHSADIHQDGIIKDPANYAFVSPTLGGAAKHRFVLTARSGRSAVAHVARSRGYTLTPDQVDAVYTAVLAQADASAAAVSEDALAALVAEVATEEEPVTTAG
ncbi:MAG: 2-isopropylmalate synthase [Candidatus Hydrogenedentota bacterium]